MTSGDPKPRRLGLWGIVDQVLSSATNLLLPVVGLRSLAPAAADRLSVLLAVTFLLVGVSRGAVGESFTVYAGRQDRSMVGDIRRGFLAFAHVCGVGVGAVIGVVGIVYLHSPAAAVAMAAAMTFVILQDACRYVMFEAGEARSVAINDFVWLVLFALLCLSSTVRGSVENLFLAWSGSGAVCSALALRQLRLWPSLAALRRHRMGSFRLVCGLGAEYVVTSGVPQVLMALVGLYAVAGDGARYRMATTLLTPAGVVATGLVVALQPQVLRSAVRSHSRRLVIWAWGLSGLAVSACTLVVFAVPERWGVSAFGAIFARSKSVLLCLAIAGIAQSGAVSWNMHVRADGLIRRTLVARTTLGIVTLIVACWLAPRYGAVATSVLYAAFSWAILASLVWVVHRQATRLTPRGPSGV
jgi:hypothetical protein